MTFDVSQDMTEDSINLSTDQLDSQSESESEFKNFPEFATNTRSDEVMNELCEKLIDMIDTPDSPTGSSINDSPYLGMLRSFLDCVMI